jgi:hypothetical protein
MKMRRSIGGSVFFIGACVLAGAAGWAQQSPGVQKQSSVSTDLSVTYNAERGEVASVGCDCLWLQGGGVDAAVTFWKGLGIAGTFTGNHAGNVAPGVDINKLGFMGGPRYTYTASASGGEKPRFQIFAQSLFGRVHAFDGVFPSSSGVTPTANSFAIQAGGGLNIFLTRHLGVRVIEADYVRTGLPNNGDNTQNDLRLGAGLVYHIGAGAPPSPMTLSASVSPASIFPGDPVTVTAAAGNLLPKLSTIYSWSGVPGLMGTGETATLDSAATAALAPGTYTVKVAVKEGKPGREGLKPWEVADATATFTVKDFEPPTIGCSASPTTINPGDKATITASGVSPQNRPLTYSFSAASGNISGAGASATFDSTGAATGAVAITCNVSDDKGHSAASTTTVTITAPYVQPVPHTQALCSISFERDKARPTRVDNEAKACLDQVALTLQNQADAKAVLVGESDAKEKASLSKQQAAAAKRRHARPVVDPAAERAVDTKQYLVTEKGIDPSRVAVETGSTDGKTVEDYLVPAGATFGSDVQGTTPVNENAVKPQVRKPLGRKRHRRKRPAAQ